MRTRLVDAGNSDESKSVAIKKPQSKYIQALPREDRSRRATSSYCRPSCYKPPKVLVLHVFNIMCIYLADFSHELRRRSVHMV